MEENISSMSQDKEIDKQLIGVDAYRKNYRLLIQLSRELKGLLLFYDLRQKEHAEQHQIVLLLINKSIFPTLTKHIHQIIDPQVIFKKRKYQAIIQQLVQCIKIGISITFDNLSLEQKRYYQQVVVENKAILELLKRTNKFSQSELTAQRMFKLDILSIFLKINMHQRKKYNLCSAVIPPRFICQIFKVSLCELIEYSQRFQQYKAIIVQQYQCSFEQLIKILAMVESKIKVSDYKRANGIAKTKQININIVKCDQLSPEKDLQFDQHHFVESRQNYKYKFCEIAFLSVGYTVNKSIDKVKESYQSFIKIAIQQISKQ